MSAAIGPGDWLICVDATPCKLTGYELSAGRLYQVREVVGGWDIDGLWTEGVLLEGVFLGVNRAGLEYGWLLWRFVPAGRDGMFNELLTVDPIQVREDA